MRVEAMRWAEEKGRTGGWWREEEGDEDWNSSQASFIRACVRLGTGSAP